MSATYTPPPGDVPVVYEDAHVLVVDKPSGLLSVPGKGLDLADCVIARLERAFPTVRLVHRLDRDTSGVMIFALTDHAQRVLGQQFEGRKVKKTYVARVSGCITQRTGEIDFPLTVDWPNRPRQKVCHDTGKSASTMWRVVRTGEAETRVRLMPKTGRSHQLRVHMLALGHPILGDPFYHPTPDDHARLMLHSEEIRFSHPETGIGQAFRVRPEF